jgi:hypothetical protein
VSVPPNPRYPSESSIHNFRSRATSFFLGHDNGAGNYFGPTPQIRGFDTNTNTSVTLQGAGVALSDVHHDRNRGVFGGGGGGGGGYGGETGSGVTNIEFPSEEVGGEAKVAILVGGASPWRRDGTPAFLAGWSHTDTLWLANNLIDLAVDDTLLRSLGRCNLH